MVGKTYPSEKSSWRDAETGAEVTQYTSVGNNRTLYFTNRPYLAGGEQLVFLSDRSGRNEMFLLHLASGKITQLTDLAGQPNCSSCVHPTRPELYVAAGQTIYRVRCDTLAIEELVRAPDGFKIGILNLNAPPWLTFTAVERRPQLQIRRAGDWGPSGTVRGAVTRELFLSRPLTLIYRLDLETCEATCLWAEHKNLSHVQMSPVDPNLVVYSSWRLYGPDECRCYYLDAARAYIYPQPVFPESATARAGHECFTRRGNLYAQWMEGCFEPGRPKQLYHAFKSLSQCPAVAVADAAFAAYELPENNDWMVDHFTLSQDESWGVHDRWLSAPDMVTSRSWLSLFRHREEHPQTVDLRFCFHNGGAGEPLDLGPDLTLTDDDALATYTSFIGGSANLCQVRLAPFVEQLAAY